MDVALATCAKYPNLGMDGEPLLKACKEIGLDARPVIWDDLDFDWSIPKLCVTHSTWDYHHRREEFLNWAERVSQLTELRNPVEVILWNSHKAYLRKLEEQGIPVIPTVWLPAHAQANLAEIMAEKNWQNAVIKPAVSASAFGTMLITPTVLEKGQIHLNELLARGEVLVQPYYTSLSDYGERCLVFIEGEFTHVARRPSALQENGERIAYDSHLAEPQADEITLAQKALKLVNFPLLYARVDLVRDQNNNIRLMELELIEPGMFLRFAPHAAQKLAQAMAKLIQD